MTISALKNHFIKELSGIYSITERQELFSIFGEEIFGFTKFQLKKNAEKLLLEDDIEQWNLTIEKLKTGQPYQQIIGNTEFFGLKFFVNEHVLIPRPETEELLEIAINKLRDSGFELLNFKIVDIGTGSGIIPITLKKHFPNAEISAIDISEKALEIAKKNADFHQVEINFIKADYLQTELTENYDVIISNPPYIAKDEETEIANSVKDFEPNIALFSPTKNALIFYEKIAQDCTKFLNENGFYFLEINQKLGKETLNLFKKFSEKELLQDLSGNDRFVVGRK